MSIFQFVRQSELTLRIPVEACYIVFVFFVSLKSGWCSLAVTILKHSYIRPELLVKLLHQLKLPYNWTFVNCQNYRATISSRRYHRATASDDLPSIIRILNNSQYNEFVVLWFNSSQFYLMITWYQEHFWLHQLYLEYSITIPIFFSKVPNQT